MKNTKAVLLIRAHLWLATPSLTSVGLTLATLMLIVATVTTWGTAQTYKDLHNFGNLNDGSSPIGVLAQGRNGSIYGTTQGGGGTTGCGVVFVITPRGGEAVGAAFDGGADGCNPYGGMTLALDGNLYGTTEFGGGSMNCGGGCGTIFKGSPGVFGSLTTLFSFYNSYYGPGVFPLAPPILGRDHALYGSTWGIGYGLPGQEAIYRLTLQGLSRLATPISTTAPLLQGADGNFYGTSVDTAYVDGAVFQMTPQGNLTFIYNFDGAHGATPNSGALIQGTESSFYGTTQRGGTYGEGVIFQLTPQGVVTVLHNFGDPNFLNDGTNPYAGLLQATDGNFYGVTASGGSYGYGVIFQLRPDGTYSTLYNFDGTHGAAPESTPLQHTNGKIYGLASSGGAYGYGVVYSFDMGLSPFVTAVSNWGKVASTGEFLGQGFTGTTSVSFNGTATTFNVVSDTYLTAKVPSGAATGFVTVTTPTGVLTSNVPFHVIP